MTMAAQATLALEEPNPCRLLVLSEDASTHARAMDICNRILSRLDAELDFAVAVWRFSDLENLVSAHRAAEALARADILLLSLRGKDLSPDTLKWLEAAGDQRYKSAGARALTVTESPPSNQLALQALLLRGSYLANRFRMDFLLLLPPEMVAGAESEEGSPVLPNATPEKMGDNHWGLNE